MPNFRVHFAFYVDVQNVVSAAKAREVAADVFTPGDLVDSQIEQRPLNDPRIVPQIRRHIVDRARAWFQRTELKP